MSVSDFLAYWATPHGTDPAAVLFDAHKAAEAQLRERRALTLKFLQPVKNSKGAWVPGFAPDAIDDVVKLASDIEVAVDKLKSIRQDIEAFLDITEGSPTLAGIVAERTAMFNRRKNTERRAAAMLKRALDADPAASPAVLMQRGEIAEAYAAVERAQSETEGALAELEEKIRRANAILEKHREGEPSNASNVHNMPASS